jgi:hypothetical protein
MSQEVTNVKKFVSGIKSKPLQQPKNKKKKKATAKRGGGLGYSSEDKVTGDGVVDGEIVEPRIAGELKNEPEIYDAEIIEPKALTRGQRQITSGQRQITSGQRQITSGQKSIEAPKSRQFNGY